MKRLGLDISTSCTGWALCESDDSGVLKVELGHIPLAQHKDLIQKSQHVHRVLGELHSRHNIDEVYIEENMQAFHPGGSSAQTIVKLAKFNGIVNFLCHQVTGRIPVDVNVNWARRFLGIRLLKEKDCGITTKEQVFRWVHDQPAVAGYPWPYRTLSSGPRKGTRVLESCAYDMSDAFIVVMAGPAARQSA